MHHKSKRRRSRHRRHSRRYRKKGGQSQLNPSTIHNSMGPVLNYSYGQSYGFSGDKVSLDGLGAASPTPHTSYAKCKLNVVRENL